MKKKREREKQAEHLFLIYHCANAPLNAACCLPPFVILIPFAKIIKRLR